MKLLVLIQLLVSFPVFGAITLKDAFRASRNNMETLRRADAELKQAIERKNQARGSLLPNVSAVGNKTWIDEPDQTGVNRAFVLTKQHSSAINIRQPLLRGGSVSAFQLRKDEVLLSELQKDASEIALFQLVINAYFDVHLARADLKNLKELMKLSADRVKEIGGRAKVGRSRKGELVQAQTQLLTAETQHKQGEINLQRAEEVFRYFTKLEPTNLAGPSILPTKLPPLVEFLEKLKQRPDLVAKRQEVRVAEQRVSALKGGHWPSVDLVGNRYIDRTGVLETSDWDVAVQVNIPLYQGGTVVSQVREGAAAKRVAELNAAETIRSARRDLEILYQNFELIHSQLKSLKGALSKAEEGYRLNLQDYKYGLVTNLEVLQSLNLYIETKRSYDSLLTTAHMTYHNLQASIGALP